MSEIFHPTNQTIALYKYHQNRYAELRQNIRNINEIVSNEQKMLQIRANAEKVAKTHLLFAAWVGLSTLAINDMPLWGCLGASLIGAAAVKIITWTDGTKIAGWDKETLIELIDFTASLPYFYTAGNVLLRYWTS